LINSTLVKLILVLDLIKYLDYLCPGLVDIYCPIVGTLYLNKVEEKGGV